MGYLTTITFYNDATQSIREHPEKLSEIVYKAQIDFYSRKDQLLFGKTRTDSIGSHANPVIIQKPRHADDQTLYLHAGNTVIDIGSLDENDDWAIDAALAEMKYRTKKLKELKALKNNKK